MNRRLVFSTVPALIAAAILTACGTTLAPPGSLTQVSGYQAASAFSYIGHKVSSGPNGGVRVTASGTAVTPAARLEKIALARAAEYGTEQGHKSFAAGATNFSIICGKSTYSERGGQKYMKPTDLRIAEIDVSYSNSPPDATARATKGTAAALKAELDAEVVPPETQSALGAEVSSQCGR